MPPSIANALASVSRPPLPLPDPLSTSATVLHSSSAINNVKAAHTRLPVPELFPVLDSQPAGDVSHKPGGRLPLLSDRPAPYARQSTTG